MLKGASFDAPAGCVCGILGGNGSGKSTLLRILAGALRADAGSAALLEDGAPAGKSVAAASAYVPQESPLMEELSALDNLRLWYGKRALEESLESGYLADLGVGGFLRTRVDRLSGGMKKRLVIGCAMAKDPKILLLDEPTAALDLAAKDAVLSHFGRFCARGGIAVIATHDPLELALCTEWNILRGGVLHPHEYGGDPKALAKLL